jgi:ABC-2 type transport system permease protein
MNLKRVFKILRKDFSVGPRKPFFIWALIIPFVLTLLFQFAFGSLFEPKPRLGIVDFDSSELTEEARALEGFEVTILNDEEELLSRVESHDFDAGLVLSAGFDDAVRTGKKPLLKFYMSGESLASNRIIIAVSTVEMIRGLEGVEAPVEINMIYLGEPGLPISIWLVPVLVFYALVMAGIWVPSASLVEEKENGTLTAMIVTSAKASEVLAAKWLLGFLFAVFLAVATLLLNRAFGTQPFEVLAVIAIAAALTAEIGLIIGIVSKTATMLFTLIKSLGIFLFIPVIFYLFPEWPQWIAKFFPLYWIIKPIWEVSVMGEPISSVWFEIVIATAIIVGLIPLIVLLKKRIYA